MAKASVDCVCEKCGKDFRIVRNFETKKEAEQYENYIKGRNLICKECYKKRRDEMQAKEAAEYGFPTIEGVSEKQIQYANRLRNTYICQNKEKIEKYLKYENTYKSQEFPEKCKNAGVTPEEAFEYVVHESGMDTIRRLYDLTSAKMVIQICSYHHHFTKGNK